MGAKQSASSSSKGGMSNKSAKTNAVVQGKKADDYARKKLGIEKTDDGYMSTKSNQMYGASYNEARGEYLASQGLATARQVTDAMGKTRTVYDPRTADGTYTDMSRMSALEARANRTPLSKEMYASQQKFKTAVGAITSLAGVPLIPSIIGLSATQPYANYLTNTENKGFYTAPSSQGLMNNNKTGTSSGTPITGPTKESEEQKARRKRLGSKTGDSSLMIKGRNLLSTIGNTFSN
jgi:hypothetical protein